MKEFSRKKAHREHMIRNLLTSLILYEKVDTTTTKASEVKGFLDHVISHSSAGDLNATRYLNSVLFDRNATKKVIAELLPRYKGRKSGFTRTFPLKNRAGDNAPMIRIELIDKKVFIDKESVKLTSAKGVDEKVEENDGK